MAELSINTQHPTPKEAPTPPRLTDLDQLVTDLRTKAAACYFGVIGASHFYRDSTANPGDFDGLLDLARDCWTMALEAERLTEALVAKGDPS